MEEIPLTAEASSFVSETRGIIEAALKGNDDRLVVVVGPCSIHDVNAALDYAGKLAEASKPFEDELLVVMRAYFEKPRTTVGWKGLVNDPDLDGTFHINKGLRTARKFLSDLAKMKVPAGTEFLDTTVPQHIADHIAWGAIGARTTESQTHRELASGLSMPVGFKNATDGNVQVAIDAMKAARQPHWFPGSTKDGVSAILQSTGNDSCHVVLRGGSRTGPNYDSDHVKKTSAILEKEGLPTRVMIDLSHANSLKNHERQVEVGADVAKQILAGGPIFGVMIESHLVGGRQDAIPGQDLVYGQSITDSCLAFDPTMQLLETLAKAVGAR
jgi:3-deoxy-7-phosphoheptulonate synthase